MFLGQKDRFSMINIAVRLLSIIAKFKIKLYISFIIIKIKRQFDDDLVFMPYAIMHH